MTTTDHARREDEDGVITITFTREAKRNAVSLPMITMIKEAAWDLADDDRQRVLVITGEGPYFTSGLDITTMRTDLGVGSDGKIRSSITRHQYRNEALHDFYDTLEAIEKPIVVAAQGNCLGIGIEMAASCDFRFAAEGIRFGLPEVANLAVIPGSGGISRLTRLIGPHWTKWLAMAGQAVDADHALRIGLVHAVYPAEEFSTKVAEFARHLAGLPSEAVGLSKLAIDAAVNADRRTSRDIDRLAQSILFQSVDFTERQQAFVNRGKA